MSHAWKKLRAAVGKLVRGGSQRERLAEAIIELAALKVRDLPLEIRPEFVAAMDCVGKIPVHEHDACMEMMIGAMKDSDVNLMVHSILNMYDAVTRYQPIPYSARAPAIPQR
jgi:hypothetical protein